MIEHEEKIINETKARFNESKLEDPEMKLREAERKLDEIDSRLNDTESRDDFDSKDLRFDSYVEINGDIYVNGSLYTDNLTVSSINGINATLPSEDYTIDFKDVKNLTIESINGIPVENIR